MLLAALLSGALLGQVPSEVGHNPVFAHARAPDEAAEPAPVVAPIGEGPPQQNTSSVPAADSTAAAATEAATTSAAPAVDEEGGRTRSTVSTAAANDADAKQSVPSSVAPEHPSKPSDAPVVATKEPETIRGAPVSDATNSNAQNVVHPVQATAAVPAAPADSVPAGLHKQAKKKSKSARTKSKAAEAPVETSGTANANCDAAVGHATSSDESTEYSDEIPPEKDDEDFPVPRDSKGKQLYHGAALQQFLNRREDAKKDAVPAIHLAIMPHDASTPYRLISTQLQPLRDSTLKEFTFSSFMFKVMGFRFDSESCSRLFLDRSRTLEVPYAMKMTTYFAQRKAVGLPWGNPDLEMVPAFDENGHVQYEKDGLPKMRYAHYDDDGETPISKPFRLYCGSTSNCIGAYARGHEAKVKRVAVMQMPIRPMSFWDRYVFLAG